VDVDGQINRFAPGGLPPDGRDRNKTNGVIVFLKIHFYAGS